MKPELIQIKKVQLSLMAEALRNGGSKRLVEMANELHHLCRQACEQVSFRHGAGRVGKNIKQAGQSGRK